MKRGKDDEKVMGPMFPRLHVNDTERGGPRAPPRNKMALYEQLSIPTQRFNSSFMPLHPSSTSSSFPPASSNQGNSLEINSFLPHSVPPSTSSRPSENFSAHQSARAALNSSLSQREQRNKVGDEDDFSVPVYINSDMDHSHGKTQDDIDKGTASPFRQTYTGHPTRIQDISNQDPKRNSFPRNLPSRETTVGPVKGNSESPNQEYEDLPSPSFRRLNNGNTSLEQKSRAQAEQNDCSYDGESIRDIEKGADSPPRCDSCSREDCCHPNELNIHTDHCGNNTCEPLPLENGDKSDDFSETSMVDSMSGMNISPDDVVGIIGQKHFWKARRAIANQQRVFAVQVFELHRLIKVQKLIAGSPQYLHDDSAFLGKPTLKASSAKKLPSQYIVKPLPHIMKRKNDFEKPSHKMEHSAENAVGKVPPSSVNNGSHVSNYGPYRTNLPSTPPTPTPPTPTNDSRMNPWFQQSPGHQQWLVPVMSPSEGLVYKPYPGPGFVGSVCGGGCGSYGPIPMTGNFMNPAYGVPPPVHNQGMGVPPPSHPVGHGFFPPYGMPIMSPSITNSAAEYNNQFTGPTSNGVGAYNSMQHCETSCYVPTQKSGSDQRAMEFQASRATDVQGSTTSSPRERVQANGMVSAGEGRDAVSTFCTAAPVMVLEEAAQSHETGQPGRVIRVVPHNPRSATESAARIFQSIQAERKHNDSV